MNGIPTGTTYSVFIEGGKTVIKFECRREQLYTGVVHALSRAVLWRLVGDLAGRLRSGARVAFGSVLVADNGLWLTKQNLFRNETMFFEWSQLLIISEGGSFVISSKAEKGFVNRLPYITTDNAHVLEMAMRILWKQGSITLSESVFDGKAT